MATGEVGAPMVIVVINVEAVFKNDSDIVIIPPPVVVVLVALVTPRWCEHVTCNGVQVGPDGAAGALALYRVMVVSGSGSVTVRKGIVPVVNHPSVFVIFIAVVDRSCKQTNKQKNS